MTLLILLISVGLIWVNLTGLGLVGFRLCRDYAVARVGGVLVLCLACFGFEHFWGLGPSLWFLPLSTALAGWLIWRDRALLRREWAIEAAFGAGFLYCLLWRYAFPNIDLFEERFPDFVFIQDYFGGGRLPAPDRWMAPFRADFYYSFQYYSAALLGRWFHLGPGYTYQLAYGVVSGLITAAVFGAARRLCAWRPAAPLLTAALLLGGCGLGLIVHLASRDWVEPLQMARYLGMNWPPESRTSLGLTLDHLMYPPGGKPIELPVEPLSYLVMKGEFHPPLAGFLVLMFSLLLIATLEGEGDSRWRPVLHSLLAATLPLSLISNTWVFPLQSVLVLGWFVHRALAGERDHWLPGLAGLGAATALAFPFLVVFMQGSGSHTSSLRVVRSGEHSSVVGWLSVFWPLVALMLIAPWPRERRRLALFFTTVWAVLLVATELFYNHDVNSGSWERFNSTLKWWGWIYGGGVLTLGAINLSRRGWLCRYGSLLVILLPGIQVYDYARQFVQDPKDDMGCLDGSHWITRDYTLRDLVSALQALPDGICLDSNLTFGNTDATVLPIFANKQVYMGWPVQEGIWREFRTEIRPRMAQVNAFYAGTMDDPLEWLLNNNIRYVMWLQKDNDHNNERFLPLWNKIRSRYAWRHLYGTDTDWAVGYWERQDLPSVPAALGPPARR